MAVPNSSYPTDLVNSTLRYTRGVVADNFTEHSVVLSSIKSAGGYETLPGGREIQEPVRYQGNGTIKSYSKYEPFDLQPTEHTTSANYSWKQIGGTVSISGIEAFQNGSSKHQLFSLLDQKMQALSDDFYETVDDQLVADGTGNGGKDIGGLALLVEEGGNVSTVGGIDSSTYSFWANQSLDFDNTYTGTFGQTDTGQADTNGMNAFRSMLYSCTRKSERPNLILTTADVRQLFEAVTETHYRTQSLDAARLGFNDSVNFSGIPIVWDANVPAGTAWFLNTKRLRFVVGKGHDFKMSGFEAPIDQDAKVAKIHLYCALTTNWRAGQGVIFDIA